MADENFVAALLSGDVNGVSYFLTSRGGIVSLEDEVDPLLLGVRSGSLEIVELLWTTCGSQLVKDYKDVHYNLLLTTAIRGGGATLLNFILNQVSGARENINSRNSTGRTPLMAAVSHPDTMHHFLRYSDIELNAVDRKGDTALHLAARLGNLQSLSNLIQSANIQTNVKNRFGETPLHILISTHSPSHLQCLRKLLEASTEEDFRSPHINGSTPVHLALNMRNIPAIKLLLMHKETGVVDPGDLLHTAWSVGFESVRLLLGAGLPHSTDPVRRRIEHMIVFHGRQSLLPLFKEEEEVYENESNSAQPLFRIGCLRVREILIQSRRPYTIIPSINQLILNGEISRNIGEFLYYFAFCIH